MKKITSMDIGKIIREARKAKGWTLDELSHRVETDSGNLSRLERGKQFASKQLLSRIMKILEIELSSPTTLLDANDNVAPTRQPIRREKEYPLISWVNAGFWAESPDNYQPGDADDWFLSTENAGERGFWLSVRGDSMTCNGTPTFPEGSYILVRPNAELISGKYYVVKLLDSGEHTFKQYVEDAGHKYLRPLNSSYRIIEINENCHFVGRVIDTKMSGL
ncbi:LexA family protein [Pseudomonas protegens]|uniref:LexA family protein n=1 Tax=Pseudomonas protegens TaxID=380021 RepID=UPI00382BB7F9